MNAVFTQIPAGRSIDANLRAAVGKNRYLPRRRGSARKRDLPIPDLKYNGVKYAVDFTVVGNDGATFQIRLNNIV